MFDCVMPTRNGRNGMLFTKNGIMNMRNKKWEDDYSPIAVSYTHLDVYKRQEFMLRNNKVIILSRILISYSFIALALTCFGLFGISWYAVYPKY